MKSKRKGNPNMTCAIAILSTVTMICVMFYARTLDFESMKQIHPVTSPEQCGDQETRVSRVSS